MTPPTSTPTNAADTIQQLRARMTRMQDGVPRLELETHPALAGLVQLRAGGSYSVDSSSLALALMAGPSRAGGWCAVVGVTDFGAEAALALGVDLTRTVLVPEPGDQWLEVTAALVDVATVVVVRTRGRVPAHVAEKLGARLRKRSSVLVAQERTSGDWPRCEVRLTTREPAWSGVGEGHGHLRARRLVVEAQRGSAPPRRGALWFPAEDQSYVRAERDLTAVPAVEAAS
ncbi:MULTISPECIES: hypothetical protein [unclassified Nocardioides]|uniref:hypothetical protein n=1 Tax=unclassified Nocardioides TaxID=2615069 RepID=UPI0009F151BD|nr:MULTISPECIES: hypothetical protein [unclassified Nocardioides]GAW49963.1 uncharacterized protein PD653B2_2292 [Nocardioides sp. PD653-B2]GAW55944.1 uncharacterized protein PD653_3372 [Nocardioides sp. PD653]